MPTPPKKRTGSKPVHRKQPQHFEVTWDETDGYSPMTIDARSLTLPAIAVIAVVGAFIWATWMYSEDRNTVNRRIDQTVTSVERLASSVKTLAEALTTRAENGYTIQNHMIFCAQAEAVNKGWKCPSFGALPDAGLKEKAKSVQREMEEVTRGYQNQ
jgi:hypothetical protein